MGRRRQTAATRRLSSRNSQPGTRNYWFMTARQRRPWWRRHSLSLVAGAILLLWIVLYTLSSPETHAGSFFGNAIADWTGLVVMVLATKHLYEKGSAESKQPLPGVLPNR